MIVNLSKRLFERLTRKKYRDAYVAEHVRTGIAYQVRALREQRDWNQGRFADELKKPQSVVSRLENPDYGKLNLSTLLHIAATFDVALIVRFVSFPEFLRQSQDVSMESMEVASFDEAAFVALPSRPGQMIVDTFQPPKDVPPATRPTRLLMIGDGDPTRPLQMSAH